MLSNEDSHFGGAGNRPEALQARDFAAAKEKMKKAGAAAAANREQH